LSKDTLLKSLLGIIAIVVVASAILYVLYKRVGDDLGLTKVFDELDRKPDIAGTVDSWAVSGDVVNTFIEVEPDDFQRFLLTFDKNTKYRQSKTPDVENRTLLRGALEDLRVSRTVEIYLATPPYKDEQKNIVDTVIYW